MSNGIVASNFRAINKGTLIGSVDIEITAWHLAFKEMLWFRKEGKEWLSFPTREFTDRTGAKKHVEIIEFTNEDVRARFQASALQAVHAIVGGP